MKLADLRQKWRHLRHKIGLYCSYLRNRTILCRIRNGLAGTGRKIIVVTLLEHIGDIVASEPVARHVKLMYPGCHIVWGVRAAYRELLDTNPHVDTVLTLHCLSERLMLAQSGYCDAAIDLHFYDRYCTLCAKPLLRPPDSKINLTNFYHYGSILSALSQSAGLPALHDTPRMYIPDEAGNNIDSLLLPESFVVIHCTSNAVAKDWRSDKWQELVEYLIVFSKLNVVEIGLSPVLLEHDSVIDLCGQLSILETAEVIRRAQLFIGVDSGPAHLANAVGTPGVVLLGSYLGFDSYTPFSGGYATGETATLVRADGAVATIPLFRVTDAVKKILAKRAPA